MPLLCARISVYRNSRPKYLIEIGDTGHISCLGHGQSSVRFSADLLLLPAACYGIEIVLTLYFCFNITFLYIEAGCIS